MAGRVIGTVILSGMGQPGARSVIGDRWRGIPQRWVVAVPVAGSVVEELARNHARLSPVEGFAHGQPGRHMNDAVETPAAGHRVLDLVLQATPPPTMIVGSRALGTIPLPGKDRSPRRAKTQWFSAEVR